MVFFFFWFTVKPSLKERRAAFLLRQAQKHPIPTNHNEMVSFFDRVITEYGNEAFPVSTEVTPHKKITVFIVLSVVGSVVVACLRGPLEEFNLAIYWDTLSLDRIIATLVVSLWLVSLYLGVLELRLICRMDRLFTKI